MDFQQLNEDIIYQYHKMTPINELADVGFGVEVHNDDDKSKEADQLKFAHFHWKGVHFKFKRTCPKNMTELRQMIAFKREQTKISNHELTRLCKLLKSKPPINDYLNANTVYELAMGLWKILNKREIDYIH